MGEEHYFRQDRHRYRKPTSGRSGAFAVIWCAGKLTPAPPLRSGHQIWRFTCASWRGIWRLALGIWRRHSAGGEKPAQAKPAAPTLDARPGPALIVHAQSKPPCHPRRHQKLSERPSLQAYKPSLLGMYVLGPEGLLVLPGNRITAAWRPVAKQPSCERHSLHRLAHPSSRIHAPVLSQ